MSGQTTPDRWAGPGEGEEDRVGQEHPADHRPHAERRAGVGRQQPQPLPIHHVGRDRQHGHGEDGEHHDHDQQLCAQEELGEDQQAQGHAGLAGAVALPHEDLVEHGQDQRQQHEGRRHQVAELQAGQHER